MEKDKIFFGESGITTTSANYLANIAKEAYRLIEEELDNIKFYTTKISLISSKEANTLRNGDRDISQISAKLHKVANYKSLIAWLREAIKAKERLIKEAMNYSDSEIAEMMGISDSLPEVPKMVEIPSEDDVIATWNIKKRNRYLYLCTLSAQIGSYVHPDGHFFDERKALQQVLDCPNEMIGNGRDTIIRYHIATVTLPEVDELYFNLQNEYREYQAELNSMKHEIETVIQENQRKANALYKMQMADYSNQMGSINAGIKEYRQQLITEMQSLKIIIPDSLQPIYKAVSELGKK